MNNSIEFATLSQEPWSSCNYQSIVIGGISLRIYGIPEIYHHSYIKQFHIPNQRISCRIIFVLHGRQSDMSQLDALCRCLCSINVFRPNQLPNIVITLDHRNHGTRFILDTCNQSWSITSGNGGGNPFHAIDMYAIQHGTTMDISYLIDHLPIWFQINSQINAVSWGVAGISLGGHSALLAVTNDHRVDMALSIVGCGDYETLMHHRYNKIKTKNPDTKIGSWDEVFPDSLRQLVHRIDPIHRVYSLIGTRSGNQLPTIILIGGGNDTLVPDVHNDTFYARLQQVYQSHGGSDRLFHYVDPDAGHECSFKMAKMVQAWLQETL